MLSPMTSGRRGPPGEDGAAGLPWLQSNVEIQVNSLGTHEQQAVVSVKKADGANLGEAQVVFCWISGNATGDNASMAVGQSANVTFASGLLLQEATDQAGGYYWRVLTQADGTFTITIEDLDQNELYLSVVTATGRHFVAALDQWAPEES